MNQAHNTEERRDAAERRGAECPRPAGDNDRAGQAPGAAEASSDAAGAAGAGGAAPPTEALGVAELQDRWRRAVADADNLRKRYERQLEQVRRTERDRVTAAWLPVLDHLELALAHAEADPASIVTGVQAVRQQALSVLAGLGYQRVGDVGARFDPSLHEAGQVVRDADAEPNTVVAVLRPGYTGERALLRPAVVAVAAAQE